MFDRIMAAIVGLGIGALAVFLLLDRYTAPAYDADITTSKLMPELAAETGLSGLYLLDAQSISGNLVGATQRCVVYVAKIEALQPLGRAHWEKVIYSSSIDRLTGVVTVQSHLAGPAVPVFAAAPET